MKSQPALTRTRLLRSASLAIGAFAATRARAAEAAPIPPPENCVGGWIAKPDVDYQNHPKGRAACASCTRFHRDPKAPRRGVCDYVCGPVAATGWCDKYNAT